MSIAAPKIQVVRPDVSATFMLMQDAYIGSYIKYLNSVGRNGVPLNQILVTTEEQFNWLWAFWSHNVPLPPVTAATEFMHNYSKAYSV